MSYVKNCPRCQQPLLDGSIHCSCCRLDLSLWERLCSLKSNLSSSAKLVSGLMRTLNEDLKELERALLEQGLDQPPGQHTGLSLDPSSGRSSALDGRSTLEGRPNADRPTREVATPPTSEFSNQVEEGDSVASVARVELSEDEQLQRRLQREVTVGQKWLLIAGITITLFGVVTFLKYSAERDWIGPTGQIALAYGAGLLAMVLGEVFRFKGHLVNFGLPIVGGGIAIGYLTTFAAHQVYRPALLSSSVAFAVMIGVTVLTCILALFHSSRWLAILALIGGVLSPILFDHFTQDPTTLMTYVTILNIGILTIAAFKRWEVLTILAFTSTWLLFAIWYFSFYSPDYYWSTLVFVQVFFLLFAIGPYLYRLIHSEVGPLGGLTMTWLNAVIAFTFSLLCAARWGSQVAFSYGGLFYLLASLHWLRIRPQKDLALFSPHIILGTLFWAVGALLYFDGYWITIVWFGLASLVLWLSLAIASRRLFGWALGLLFLALAKFVFHDYGAQFGLDLRNFFTSSVGHFGEHWMGRWLTTAVALLALQHASWRVRPLGPPFESLRGPVHTTLLTTFVVLLFTALNLEISAFFFEYAQAARFAAISVLWALYAVGLMIWGFLSNLSVLRKSAMGLFAATLVKIFAVDMAAVSTPWRILSFVALGLLLISMSYLYHRYRERI